MRAIIIVMLVVQAGIFLATAWTILFARATLTYDGGAPVDGMAEYAIPVLSATEAQPLTLTVVPTPNPAVPLAPLDDGVVLRNLAGEGEEESKSVFGHSHMIDSGTEGHRNTQLCGGLEVHLVHTNAILGQHLEAGQAFVQPRACERVVTAQDSVVVPNKCKDGGLRQGPTRPLNVIGISCEEIMVPARCVLERRRGDQDARLAHGVSNLVAHLPQHFMLKVNDLIVQGCLLPQGLPMLGSLSFACNALEEMHP